jgi:hypothetical protein
MLSPISIFSETDEGHKGLSRKAVLMFHCASVVELIAVGDREGCEGLSAATTEPPMRNRFSAHTCGCHGGWTKTVCNVTCLKQQYSGNGRRYLWKFRVWNIPYGLDVRVYIFIQ